MLNLHKYRKFSLEIVLETKNINKLMANVHNPVRKVCYDFTSYMKFLKRDWTIVKINHHLS